MILFIVLLPTFFFVSLCAYVGENEDDRESEGDLEDGHGRLLMEAFFFPDISIVEFGFPKTRTTFL